MRSGEVGNCLASIPRSDGAGRTPLAEMDDAHDSPSKIHICLMADLEEWGTIVTTVDDAFDFAKAVLPP